jgi:hypothetical protein
VDVILWTTGTDYGNLLQELSFLNFFSSYTLCSGTHNFFVVYRILAYK